MILVTVGMHTDGFSRLVEAMDHFAGEIEEPVIMQIGTTRYEPQAASWFTFTTQQEMESLMQQARVVVSHAGSGSIMTALRYRKSLIVMPRLQKYGEHFDDHQLELGNKLAGTGALLMVHDTAELTEKLDEANHFQPRVADPAMLIAALREEVLLITAQGGGK